MPGARGDFDVKTPTTTASVRGTKFVVFYDGSATVVAVTQSSVAVRANSGRQVVVPAGKEATSTAKRVSKPVKVGHGERRGGVTAETAFDRLGAHLAVGLKRCGFDVVSGQLDPAPGGWSGSFVIVAAGDGVGDKTKGTAIFGLKGTRFRAANDLAKQILAGCR
jgi:hypothetical protein